MTYRDRNRGDAPPQDLTGDSCASGASGCPGSVHEVETIDAIAARVLAGLRPEDEERVREWAAREERARGLRAARTGEVPSRIVGLFESGKLDPNAAPVIAVRRHIADGWAVIVLSGPPGTGKSVAACIAIVDAQYGYFVRADRLVTVLASRRDLTPREHLLAHWSRTASPLVVDDVGSEKVELSQSIERFLSERYDDAESITVCTTNLDADTFHRRYGARVASRLQHVGRWVECTQVLRPRKRK